MLIPVTTHREELRIFTAVKIRKYRIASGRKLERGGMNAKPYFEGEYMQERRH